MKILELKQNIFKENELLHILKINYIKLKIIKQSFFL